MKAKIRKFFEPSKWFFATNEDGENPVLMIVSGMAGMLAAFGIIWLLAGCPKLPITTAP